MAEKFRDESLGSVDAATEKMEIDLTKKESILYELRKLYNRVDQALNNEENYAEQVTVADDHGLTTATVSLWVHLILSSNLSRKFRTLLQDLFSWHPVINTQHLSWKKLHWLPISERIKYKVACMCFSAINGSGPAYLSELLHVYTPSRTLCSSSDTRMLEIQQYKRKNLASALSFALDPTFGIHSHKTLDTAQPCHLLKPN